MGSLSNPSTVTTQHDLRSTSKAVRSPGRSLPHWMPLPTAGSCRAIRSTFVSINQEEANEKIRYLRAIVAATDLPVRPKKFLTDSRTEIEFEDGSRFISHACRPRAAKPRAGSTLTRWRIIPTGWTGISIGLLCRSPPKAAMCGSAKPTGSQRGLLGNHGREVRKFPDIRAAGCPGGRLVYLCKDVRMAKQIASRCPLMSGCTPSVRRALIEIFENMFLEDFQQEYECSWIDEATA